MQTVRIILVLVALTLVISSPCRAQWAMTYGDSAWSDARCIRQTLDGGYIVAGLATGLGGDPSLPAAWLLKLNPDGSISWQKRYGGNESEVAESMQETSDGGYIVAGYTISFGAGDLDLWVLKLNPDGSVAWEKSYGGSDREEGHSIRETSDGGYIVAGDTSSFGAGQSDFWVLKLNPDGSVAWEKTYGTQYRDEASHIEETSDGYVVVGGTDPSGTGNLKTDLWLLKLNPDGSVAWEKTYGGLDWEKGSSIHKTQDSGYIVAGTTDSFGAGRWDFWVLKLNPDGSIVWQKTYGGSSDEVCRDVQQTEDGGYIVVGYAASFGENLSDDLWLLKLNPNGSVSWQRTYGGSESDEGLSIHKTQDGGYIVAGGTESFGAGSTDIWVLKLDQDGKIPYCSAMGRSEAIVSDTSATIQDTSVVPQESFAETVDTSVSAQDTYVEPSQVCPCSMNITKLAPTHGGYGTRINPKGTGFGDYRQGMVEAQHGYYSFVTLSGEPGTMIATRYPLWSDAKVTVKFKKLFIDANGNYLQDVDEPSLALEQLPLGEYTLTVHMIWFHDLNDNGIYNAGDEIYNMFSSNSQVFTLTDEPVIYCLIETPGSDCFRMLVMVPGKKEVVKIKGLNFGDTQGTSTLHIGGRTWFEGHPKIRLWEDYKIKFKVPNYEDPFPKNKAVWVTVNGKDSNKVWMQIWDEIPE